MAKKSTYLKKQELKEIEEVIELAEFLELEEVLELQGYLQTALDVELSTVPIYLYTYYSINRNPSFDDDINGPDKGAAGNTLATYANKAGAVIMSVVVEEMLHMSLAANILKAIGGTPKVYGQSPASFPTNLPHHRKKDSQGHRYLFGLESLSENHLRKFLEIEQPEKTNAPPEKDKWETLGQFYDYITEQIKKVDPAVFANHADSQLHGQEGYYAPNNVDTIYPKEARWAAKKNPPDEKHPAAATAHQATFTNNEDSGGIRVIKTIKNAVDAMKVIKHQGEGDSVKDDKWDDKSKHEESHYYRFKELLTPLENEDTVVAQNLNQALYPAFVNNPTRAKWSQATCGASDNVIDLVNAVYSYILLMTEVSYTLSGAAQHTFFYIGMHKGMIFILDKLIGNMRSASNYPAGFGGAGFNGLAPTFENYAFGSKKTARAELTDLAARVNKALSNVCDANILQRINDLPDVNVDPKKPISFGSPS
jgi:Ferritin-like